MATIEEFSSLGLCVGRIIEVEDHEAARKPMYKLKVDVGEIGMRGIVAGLKPYYTKEELLNTLVIVVTNLAPRSIAGAISEGMILAADDGTNVSILRPDKDLAPGSMVK
jgi:methionine--tRNA ligase beta chain